ncbi:type II secretion system minor pseudopilin GspI [Erwinia sp. E_sp_B04_7]|uniref:type II secretion system minor pseudopilin GspI n=1 Tax=unclassified Erwinia TaxID=2622719 RepID=UPI0030D2BB13
MNSRGMTLLETMIAMVILAVAGIALLNSGTEKLRNLSRLEEQQFAAWMAENLAVQIRMGSLQSKGSAQEKISEAGNRQFSLRWQSYATSYEGIQRVQIDVSPVEKRQTILFSLNFLQVSL